MPDEEYFRLPRRRLSYCRGCNDWHDPPLCDGDGGGPLTSRPPWHDPARAQYVTYGWCSDHELAVTWWPDPRYL